MPQKKRKAGELIIIGGHEEKNNDPEILKVVAERVNHGLLLVATMASTEANEMWKTYRKAFSSLGVKTIEHLDLETRAESDSDKRTQLVQRAAGVFFTGGDQLRITSTFGGSDLCRIMRERHA